MGGGLAIRFSGQGFIRSTGRSIFGTVMKRHPQLASTRVAALWYRRLASLR